MPASPSCTYVVLSASGKVIPLSKGKDSDYFQVLLELAFSYQSAGGGSDIPKSLLCDGEIVQPTGLLSTALGYANARAGAIATTEANVRSVHTPAWLSE